MNTDNLAKLVTLSSLLLALTHLLFPNIAIDSVTIVLVIVAVVPWLRPLFKAIELPGGLKLEFQEFEKATKRAEDAGLLQPAPTKLVTPAYLSIAEQDPNLALAGLRIEIERRLRALAEKKGFTESRASVGRLMNYLSQKEELKTTEHAVLSDLISLLNQAVHGASVPTQAADWAMSVGPRLLAALDERLAR